MKLPALILSAFVAVCPGIPPAFAQENTTVKITPTVTHGVWEGWGTSLAWMGRVFGDRDDLADFLFTTKTVTFSGPPVPGLGLNIVRYNAGACGWNTLADGRRMQVSKTIKPFRQIESFWLDPRSADPASSSWTWNADSNQRTLLLKARDRGANRFELFANSPPWWMCANDNPSGAVTAADDNLPARNYPAFATYLATVARHARDNWGVTFDSIEPFNEPLTKWWFADCKQEGCHFSPDAQSTFIPLLRAELDRQGLQNVTIAASDETSFSDAFVSWKKLSPAAKAFVGRVNVHGYQYAEGPRAELHRAVVLQDRKPLWMSEYGKKDAGGLELARNLHRDFARLHPTAWCYWQPADSGGWGLLDADLANAQIHSVETNAYVLAHYSRHIRPGMTILGTGDANTIAAYYGPARHLVLVTFNDGPARTVTYDLSAFVTPDAPVPCVLTELQGPARYRSESPPAIRQNHLTVTLPSNAIQTLEISNAALARIKLALDAL